MNIPYQIVCVVPDLIRIQHNIVLQREDLVNLQRDYGFYPRDSNEGSICFIYIIYILLIDWLQDF